MEALAKTRTGRPLKFDSAAALQEAVDAYFKACDEASEPYTVTGLALSLGTKRQTLLNYQGRPEFFDTIEKAKARCEHWLEVAALQGKVPPGVAIFSSSK